MLKTNLWTAIITPFDVSGKIDFKSFERLLRRQEQNQNGVVLLGSTGEGMALTRSEKESVVNFAASLHLKVPCIAGVPGHGLEEVLDWVHFAKSSGIQGFLAVSPYYSKPGVKGQTEWFRKILDAASLPVMLYNVPSRTGSRLSPQVLVDLQHHSNLWALKESSGSVDSFLEYQRSNPKISLFCGDDGLMPEFAKVGAVGLVSVASNVWPEATRKVVEYSLAIKASAFADLWRECTDTLFLASNPIPTKWLHHHLGEIPTTLLRPPLDSADLTDPSRVERAHQKIKNWLKERGTL